MSLPVTPEYFYKHSPAGLTAKFQLLLRAGLFITNAIEAKSNKSVTAACQFCGYGIQDERHLFADCPHFEMYRDEAIQKCSRLHAGALPEATPNRLTRLQAFQAYANRTIRGNDTDISEYWLGQTPPLPPQLSDLEAKMAHHLAITLASRIAGAYARDRAKDKGYDRRQKRSRDPDEEDRGDESRNKRQERLYHRGRKRTRDADEGDREDDDRGGR